MVNCCIVDCKSRSTNKDEKVSFFRIPRIPKCTNKTYNGFGKDTSYQIVCKLLLARQRTWISSIHRGPMSDQQLEYSRVCSKHFLSGKPAELSEIDHPDWAPCTNLGYSFGQAIKTQAALDCYLRYTNRVMLSCDSMDTGGSCIVDNSLDMHENVVNGCVVANSDFNFNIQPHPNINNNPESQPGTQQQEPTLPSHLKNQATQTDMSMEDLSDLFKDLSVTSSTNDILRKKLASLELTQDSFVKNDTKTRYFTGLHSHELLFEIHTIISPYLSNTHSTALPTFQQLLIMLMKLRLNLPLDYLSYRFGISIYTVGRYFRNTIHVLCSTFISLVHWPDRECLHSTMPATFQESYGKNITSIIDCFESFIESPSNMRTKAECWSNYKHHKTVKNLIGIVPQGSISFISEGWGGRTSDKHLTNHCGFLNHINPGDVIMADRGFQMSQEFLELHARLLIPAYTKGKSQLYPGEIDSTRKIANLRINVERVIGCIRQKYPILASIIPVSMLKPDTNGVSLFDEITVVCCALFNICPAIVSLD